MDKSKDIATHKKNLQILCRICGQRCLKQPTAKNRTGINKTKHAERILEQYGINMDNDNLQVHPPYICLSCVASLSRHKCRPVIDWKPHKTGDCHACETINASCEGGRREKAAKVGARRRKERQRLEREAEDVKKACDTILHATSTNSTDAVQNKKLKQVASCIIKKIIDESKIVELPTGGPVRMNYKWLMVGAECCKRKYI